MQRVTKFQREPSQLNSIFSPITLVSTQRGYVCRIVQNGASL